MNKKYKTILITGAGGGLGTALIDELNGRGYRLILTTKSSSLDRYFDMPDIISVKGDITDQKFRVELAVIAARNDVDVIVNNAAKYVCKPFDQTNIDTFISVIDTNFISAVAMTQLVWGIFKRKKAGLVLNINSVAGKKGGDGESAYSSSKFALAGFAESIRHDAKKYNISVVDIFPGAFKTKMLKDRTDFESLRGPKEVAQEIKSIITKYFDDNWGNGKNE